MCVCLLLAYKPVFYFLTFMCNFLKPQIFLHFLITLLKYKYNLVDFQQKKLNKLFPARQACYS